MTYPTFTGGTQIWPGGAADPATAVQGLRPFLHPTDLTALRLAGLQNFLGIGGAASTPDDASAILATQVFGA